MNEIITKHDHDGYIVYRNEKGEAHNINDEPAFIFNDGTKQWYRNGKLHRTRGPAVISPDGREYWYYEGKEITNNVNKLMADGLSSDWENWSEEDEFLFVLLVS